MVKEHPHQLKQPSSLQRNFSACHHTPCRLLMAASRLNGLLLVQRSASRLRAPLNWNEPMTKIQNTRKIERETAGLERRRPIMVALLPFCCQVWVKGTREKHLVPWEAILDLGRKLDAREALRLKKGA